MSRATPILNHSDAQSITNGDVLAICKIAEEATARQDDKEIWINTGWKIYDAKDLRTHDDAKKMYTWFNKAANRGDMSAIRSLKTPSASIWASNVTLLCTIRYRIVKEQYRLPYPVILCDSGQRNFNEYSSVKALYLTQDNAAYGFGTEDVRTGEASAINPVDIVESIRGNLGMIAALQLAAIYCPHTSPRIVRYINNNHFNTYFMNDSDWKNTVVPWLNNLDALDGPQYQVKWKHIYNKVYQNGVEVVKEGKGSVRGQRKNRAITKQNKKIAKKIARKKRQKRR